MRAPNESAPTGQGRGAGAQATGRGLSANHADLFHRMQCRLSGFALAVDAVLPEVAYLQHVVEVVARGCPMPGDCPQRLYRIALKLHDLRNVLEVAE